MMSAVPRNLKRYYGAGDLHFITCSCYHRQPWLGSARRRDLFLTVLEQVRQRYAFVVLGYVVMPEHFNLLVCEPQRGTPSTVMQALKLGFARRVLGTSLRRRNQPTLWTATEPAHVWQRRFYDFNVWTEHKRIEKLRYMHRNPVKRGLVLEPEQWRWSSFCSYAYGEAGTVKVNGWEILKMQDEDAGRRRIVARTSYDWMRCPGPHFSQRTREMGHAHLHDSRPAREKILLSDYPKIENE
jgi:putative transposase